MVKDARQRFEKELTILVENFRKRQDELLRPSYSEAQARLDFINPFFEALGWDVKNSAGLSLEKREVKVEQGETTGKPDYNFRLNGQTQFFVEAKAPHVPLESSRVILQAKKYAFNETSQMVMLAATTDFEEFRLYEVRDISYLRRINKGLIFAYRYDQYLTPKASDDLWKLSRESVAAGSLDALITPAARRERQRIPLDQQFLSDLVEWREKLAKAIYKAHSELDADDLNNVVQIFLDRLIFIRVAEDRGVLPENQLREIARHWTESGKSKSILAELLPLFRLVNQKLNGEIFKPHKCEEMKWDSALVAEIIDEGLEPYNFAQIGVELLGSIYERYLGKTIRVTETRAIVDDKPEVRKAGGVYYTPKYIVDYIVAQTVGKLIEGKTPKQIEKLRVLDPACGSGSFLLGAYQVLLDFHTRYYADDARKKRANQPRLIDAGEDGESKLRLDQKAQILRNNIYGVDIDPQAVEITMMSLYIKMLEGERGAITGQGVLPRLHDNIRLGNSLIAHDIGALSEKDAEHIKPFTWGSKSEGFGEIMDAGGFDAVIGNPPYIGFQGFMADKEYLKGKFVSASGKFDYYLPFIEKGFGLLRSRGLLSFICPTNFMKRGHGEALRQFLLKSVKILEICDFQDVQIFSGALNYTGIFLFEKGVPSEGHSVLYKQRSLEDPGYPVRQTSLSSEAWIFRGETETRVVDKVRQQSITVLGELADAISEGIVTGQNEVFLLPCEQAEKLKLESRILRPCIRGRQIRRYLVEEITEVVIYPYQLVDGKTQVIPELELKHYPKVWSYLQGKRSALAGRPYFEASSKEWYELWNQRDINNLALCKIVVAELADSNRFSLADATGFYGDTVCGITLSPEVKEEQKYVLGILNSKLMEYYYKRTTVPKANQYYIYKTMFLKNLPIRRIDFSDPADKAYHDKMLVLVERMLDLHKQKQAAKSDAARERIEREIHVTDEQIDALVYELYGLTKEEIKIVEESTR